MKQYKLYLFDLDGTLLDSDKMIIETFRELYKIYRPDFHPDDSHILQFSGPQIRESLAKEFPNEDLEKMLSEYKNRSKKFYIQYVKLFPGARKLIETLNSKGIKYGIITNKHRYATVYTYELLDLEKFNIYSVCADDVENLKPHPEGIYRAMKDFDVSDKKDVIYIGDGLFDYLTAKNAGVDFGFVSWSPRYNKEMKIDAKIDDFREIAEEIK